MTNTPRSYISVRVSNSLFFSSTAGRDKILRVIQYWARFLSYVLYRKGYSAKTLAQWRTLAATVGLSRKLFRAGKPIAFTKNAATVYGNKTQDPILRTTSVLRNLAYAVYMATDTVTWVNVSRVRPLTHGAAITRFGLKFWLFGLSVGIINSLRKYQIASAKRQALLAEAEKDDSSLKRAEREIEAAKKQFIWDVLDVSIPVAGLGLADLDEGIVGAAGLITSIFGTQQQWAATA